VEKIEVTFIKEIFLMINIMDKDHINGLMLMNIVGISNRISRMGLEYINMRMEIYMLDSSKKTIITDMECI